MTLHYHGMPITPRAALVELAGRNFCTSFWRPDDVEWCHQYGQNNMLDNGAFSAWMEAMRRGVTPSIDWKAFYAWCKRWLEYRTSWAVILDVIMGGASANDDRVCQWLHGQRGAPVWHMHEPVERLMRLCDEWERVCIGSSAQYRVVGSDIWHSRMTLAMNAICKTGRAPTWLHMLRGMNAARWGYLFDSVDSTDIARNHNRKNNPRGMADNWDAIQCAPSWKRKYVQSDLLEAA